MVDNIGTARRGSNIDDDDEDDDDGYNINTIKGVVQEPLLPIANVGRIMKQVLPANAKISKEAKETMQECVSEFISFVTSEASVKCKRERRKTVNGDDVCWAISALGFDDYAGPLRRYLHRYVEVEGSDKVTVQERVPAGNGAEDTEEGSSSRPLI